MSPPDLSRPFRIGEWRIDPTLDEIGRDGRRIKLEPRMMRLLCCLAARPGEVVSINELLDRVWSGVVVGQSSVYQAVAHLRRLLGDTDEAPRYIATIPRKGYRLLAPVQAGDGEGAAPGDAADTPPQTEPGKPRASRRSAATIALAAAVLVVLLAGGAWFWQRAHSPVQGIPAIAVLPFDDLSEDASNQAFCDGLTDELLNSLARLPNLRVIGRTSSARFRDHKSDARSVGDALGVTHVLEGSVRRNGDRLRVSAQLVGTADGFQLWSNSFDRPASDAIQIQTQIARAVVDALSLRLAPEAEQRLERGPTTQVNAYDLYLLGRHQQQQRTPEALERAIEYQLAAIAADPGFALAHAGLADAYMARYYYANRPLDETAKLVQQEVDAALRLDPELAEAYAAWGVLLTEQWRTDEAIVALKRALSINSNYGDAYLRLGAAYEYDGQPREALAAYDQVAILDPLHTQLHVRRCLTLQNLGRYAEAERACERGFELQPDLPNALWASGLNALAQGDLAAAVGHYRAALARAPNRADIRAELVLVYADLGMNELAAREIARLHEGDMRAPQLLVEARASLAAGDTAGVKQSLLALPAGGTAPRDRVDAAFLALAAGDTGLVAKLSAGLAGGKLEDETAFEPGLYKTRWGVCELCSLALLDRRQGDAADAARLESTARTYLDQVESAGHVWHGLHYLRATLLAQGGDAEGALKSLERAVDLGWRRAWLLQADPALAGLRDQPRFARLLSRIDEANANARVKLAGSVSP